MVDEPDPTLCPDSGLLAAYIDGRTSRSERARVEGHIAECKACLDLVASVVDLTRGNTRTASLTTAVTSLPLWLGLVSAMLTMVVGLALRSSSATQPRVPAHAEQADPLAGGRLTAGLPGDRQPRRLQAAAPTAVDLHAEGIGRAAIGLVNQAVPLLSGAALAEPRRADYQSDAAAAFLAEAARTGRVLDDVHALGAAQRSLLLSPGLAEAHYNRALALERLGLLSVARDAWTEYLRIDATSPWADRARRHLGKLPQITPAAQWSALEQALDRTVDAGTTERAVRLQTSAARRYLETVLMPEWARAVVQDADGAPHLRSMRAVADAFARITGDRLYVSVVDTIQRATALGPEARISLAQAHLDYAEGAAYVAADRYVLARAPLERALTAFVAAGSPYESRARLDLAAIGYYDRQFASVDESLIKLTQRAEAASWVFVGSRSRWLRGLIAFDLGQFIEAQRHWERMRQMAVGMGDGDEAAAAHGLLANLSLHLGDGDLSWAHRRSYLRLLADHEAPRIRPGLLASAAAHALQDDGVAALTLQGVVIDALRQSGRIASLPEAFAQRALILATLGRADEARADVRAAWTALDDIDDDTVRRQLESHLQLGEARVLDELRDAGAARAAEQAIALAEAQRDHATLPARWLLLSRAQLRSRHYALAADSARNGLDTYRRQAPSTRPEDPLPPEVPALFAVAMRAALGQGEVQTAFRYGVEARMRLSALLQDAPPGLSAADVQARLAPGRAFLAFNQLEDELVTWCITASTVDVRVRPLSRHTAQRLVALQQADIARSADQSRVSMLLFDELIRPFGARLIGARKVEIAADAPYYAASFPAFFDRSSRRFWVESTAITFASSAPARSNPTSSSTLVTVSATATPEQAFDTWRRSPPDATVIVPAPVIGNPLRPGLAQIRFADDPGRPLSGVVLARDIPEMTSVRAIVLTTVKKKANALAGFGQVGVAQALLRRGAGHVITASAQAAAGNAEWAELQRNLESGVPVASAVARAQRLTLSRTRRLGSWCELVVFEGTS